MDERENPPSPEGLWKVHQVALYLGLSPQTVYRMVSEKRIPFHKIGSAVRFRRVDLDDWLRRLGGLRKH